MKIITVSREFGSGGRELSKRMSDYLGWDYYDGEIIDRLIEEQGLRPQYVNMVLGNHEWRSFPITFGHSFAEMASIGVNPSMTINTELLSLQKELMEKIAASGNDCIIVGRNADVLLAGHDPFRIFVCADLEFRVQRCIERSTEEKVLTEKEVRRNIIKIDRGRARRHESVSDAKWGDRSLYNLVVNTTGWNLKSLAPVIGEAALSWFGGRD
ncbi:MAG: cytidylate kinase-like family protein [Clostridia bacterium]|nr:cytidylate kinase-like family protein [Clostridia bacterium]